MALPRPTLSESQRRVTADVAASLGQGPLLRRSLLFQLSQAVAGAAHSQYGAIDYVFRQTFPDTAETEYLDRWAQLYGVPRLSAAFAEGQVIFTGAPGSTVMAGTRLTRSDGQRYETLEDGLVDVSLVQVRARALEAGSLANSDAGIELQLRQPVLGIESKVVVSAVEIGGGADVESDAALRARVVARLRSPGQGGNASDYVHWALEVPGVTRAWTHPVLNGLGTVGVSVMRDGDSDPAPSGAALEQIQAYIDARRPVGLMGVEVFAPEAVPVDLTIRIEPDTLQIRGLVETAVAGLLFREGGPVPRQAETFLPLSRISEAISSVAGERSHTIESPVAPPSVTARQLLTPGVITWL